MDKEVTIALCMGSSCFARGNKDLLQALENAIRQNGWEEKVAVSGLRCQEKCSDGPVLRVNGQTLRGLDAEAALDLLAKRMGVQPDGQTYSSVKKNSARKKR